MPSSKKNPTFTLNYINERGENLDMIGFHNQFFVKEMRQYILNLKDNTNILCTPRPMIHSLVTDSPLRLYNNNNTNNTNGKIHSFASPFRKTTNIDPTMTPFSAAFCVRDEHDEIRKILKGDMENSVKKLDLTNSNEKEKPNNLLLNKIKSRYEGFQTNNLHLKTNPKISNEGLKRSLFGENNKIEEIEENSSFEK